jgi:hypothetical protein
LIREGAARVSGRPQPNLQGEVMNQEQQKDEKQRDRRDIPAASGGRAPEDGTGLVPIDPVPYPGNPGGPFGPPIGPPTLEPLFPQLR